MSSAPTQICEKTPSSNRVLRTFRGEIVDVRPADASVGIGPVSRRTAGTKHFSFLIFHFHLSSRTN